MTYISPTLIRAISMEQAKGLSLFISHDFGTTTFLVGESVDPDVVVLETLNPPDDLQAGTSWPLAKTANWNGVELSGLEVEVDDTSLLPPAGGYPLLTLLRRDGDVLIVVRSEQLGRRSQAVLVEGLPVGKGSATAAFSRWRLVRRAADGTVAEVWPVDAASPAQPS